MNTDTLEQPATKKEIMNNNLQVLDIEAEEIPLEQKIEYALVKENVTDKVIKDLEERYAGMKLNSLDDKETYLQIKEARKNVRAIGIIVEKTCKKGREDAIKTQKLWLSTEKKHLDRIDIVQRPLEAEIDRFDNEVSRKENEEKKRQEAAFMQRQSILIKYGAQYNNGSLELNHISYEINNIRESDQEIWEEIIMPKYKAEFEKVEAEKVRQEKERETAILKLKQEQDELKRQQDELREAHAELKKQKDNAERERMRKEESDKMSEIKERVRQVEEIGLVYNYKNQSYELGSISINKITVLESISNHDWVLLMQSTKPQAELERKSIEEKRIADAEKKGKEDIETALQKEREEVAEKQRLEKLKQQQLEQKKADELAQASDKTRWLHFVSQLKAIEIPIMNSNIYKSKLSITREKIEEIQSL